jgi:ABC-type taurine transport system substrate-binding protein
MITYSELVNSDFDAGIYRQYIATRFGSLLIYGGSHDRWCQARRSVKQLARITGKTEEQIKNKRLKITFYWRCCHNEQ